MHPLKDITLITFFTLFAFSAYGNDDQYLLDLQSEAESSNQTESNILPLTDDALSDSQKNEFYLILKTEMPATYKTYTRLNKKNKEKVMNSYFENRKNISISTHLLFNLYFHAKKEIKHNHVQN